MKKRDLIKRSLLSVSAFLFGSFQKPLPVKADSKPLVLSEEESQKCLYGESGSRLYLGESSDVVPGEGLPKAGIIHRQYGRYLVIPKRFLGTPYVNENGYFKCECENKVNLSRFELRDGGEPVRYYMDTKANQICIQLPGDEESRKRIIWY